MMEIMLVEVGNLKRGRLILITLEKAGLRSVNHNSEAMGGISMVNIGEVGNWKDNNDGKICARAMGIENGTRLINGISQRIGGSERK